MSAPQKLLTSSKDPLQCVLIQMCSIWVDLSPLGEDQDTLSMFLCLNKQSTEVKEMNAIVICFRIIRMLANYICPGISVRANTSIEVSKKHMDIILREIPKSLFRIFVKFVFLFLLRDFGGGIGADDHDIHMPAEKSSRHDPI